MTPVSSQRPTANAVTLRPWLIVLVLGWSVFIALSLAWNIYQERTQVYAGARERLRSIYMRDQTFWQWASRHGGFYVPVSEALQLSDRLTALPDRDAVTGGGERLTLINPAAALRRYYALAGGEGGAQGRLSGLRALDPGNDPDRWEFNAIGEFRRGRQEVIGEGDIDGQRHLRLMRPLVMQAGCRQCHAGQGFDDGEVVGGISVSLPVEPLLSTIRQRTLTMLWGHGVFWLIGLIGIRLGGGQLQRRIDERQAADRARSDSEVRIGAILKTCLDAVITVDRDDRIIEWTGAAEQIFGWSRDEVLGLYLADTIVPPRFRDAHRTAMERLGRIGEAKLTNRRIELTALRRSGEEFPVELELAYLQEDGAASYSAFVRDISRRRLSEARTRRYAQYQRLLDQMLETSTDSIPFDQQLGRVLDLLLDGTELPLQSKGAIFLADKEASDLKLAVYRGLPDDYQIVCRDALRGAADCELGSSEASREAPGCQCLPLRSRDRLFGTALLFWNEGHVPARDELELLTTIGHAIASLIDRHVTEEQLEQHAYYDLLTGLPNRAMFMDWLTRTVQRSQRHFEHRFAVLFLDFDRFKNINDSLGHTLGDRMLQEVAARLQRCIRPSDTVARFGGDEFTVLLDDIEEVADALRVAERIHGELRRPIRLGEHDIYTSTSIGIAINSQGYESPDDVLRDADIAMYQAKAEGPGQTKVFDNAMHTSAVALLKMETELRHAIDHGELCVYYQPVVALQRGRIMGFEALVRWQHPERGLVSPEEFVPVAEETGLIIPLGQKVLHEACLQIMEWNHKQRPRRDSLYVSVNISGVQLLYPQWLAQVDATLVETGCSTRYLRLELTESVLMRNAELTDQVLLALKRRGIQIYLDDFGTGYSSLSYLHRYPFDALKIDRSFVRNLPLGEEHASLFRSFIAIGHNFGLDVVAEGVESAIELEEVRRLGCDAVQGFYFGEPVSAAEATRLLSKKLPLPPKPPRARGRTTT